MRTTLNISFYCRNSKKDKNGLAPVEVSLIICGQRRFMNLAFKCSPEDFNKKRKPKYIQDYIDAQRVRLATAISEMATIGTPLTVDTLKEYIQNGGVLSYTIEDLFSDYFRLIKQRVGKNLTQTVYDKYEWVKTLFKEQIDFNKEVTAITPAVIQEFYIKLQNKYQDSTSGGYMTKLKSVIKYGIDNGKIKVNPFQNIKITKGVKNIETITYSQLQDIISHNFVNRVQKVADMFVFACGSGLAFCDCMALKPEDFVEKDGKLCIFKERQKTGVKFYSVLLPWAVDVYKKYGGDFEPMKITNQRSNSYLKEIQDICGIDVNMTFHKARHFYAMYLLNKKVPVTTVQRTLGHNNISTTMHYARALENTIIDDVSKII